MSERVDGVEREGAGERAEAMTSKSIEALIDALDAYRTRSIDGGPAFADEAIWFCKIGGSFPAGALPPGGADLPMRRAVQAAYREVTGTDDGYIFSGWGGRLEEHERAVVEHRAPVYERTDWALLKGAADTIEALWSEVERLSQVEEERDALRGALAAVVRVEPRGRDGSHYLGITDWANALDKAQSIAQDALDADRVSSDGGDK